MGLARCRIGVCGELTLFDEILLIVDDADVDLGQIFNRLVLDLPEFFGDLRNQPCATGIVLDHDFD